MTTGRLKLLEEIYEQFLVCKICFEGYTRPKTLECLHTFCEQCIDKHQSAELERSYRYAMYIARSITCPICRKKTELPVGGVRRLPDNLIVPRLVDMVCRGQTGCRNKSNNNEPSFASCEVCQIQNAITCGEGVSVISVAVSKCLDCCKALCRACTDIHRRTKVTSEHSLVDVEVEDKDVTCKSHEGELIRYYCEQCSTCICVVCAFESPHRGHDVLTFSAALSRHGHALDSLVVDCKTRISGLRQQLEHMRQLESDASNAEEQVRGAAIDCIAAIRQHENNLLFALRAVFSDHTGVKAFLADRPAIESTIRALENTCQLSDVIARERSVELLLLKDDLARRMTSLLQTTHAEPDIDAENTVRFVMTSSEPIGHVTSGEGLNFGRLEFVNKKAKDVKEEFRSSLLSGVSNWSDDGDRDSTEFEGIRGGRTQRASSKLSGSSGTAKRRTTSTDSDDVEMPYVPDVKRVAQLADQTTMTDPLKLADDERMPQARDSSDIWRMESSTTMYSSVFIENKMTFTETSTIDCGTMTSAEVELSSPSAQRLQRSNESSKTSKPSTSRSASREAEAGRHRQVRCVATLTDPANTANKASTTERPFQLDKSVSTLRIRLVTKDTNTHHNVFLDSAVQTAHIPGDDKACGTPIVLAVDAFTSTNDRTMSRSRGTTGNGNDFDRLASESDVVKSSVRDKIDSFSNSAAESSNLIRSRTADSVSKKHISRDFSIDLGERRRSVKRVELPIIDCKDDVIMPGNARDFGTNTDSWELRDVTPAEKTCSIGTSTRDLYDFRREIYGAKRDSLNENLVSEEKSDSSAETNHSHLSQRSYSTQPVETASPLHRSTLLTVLRNTENSDTSTAVPSNANTITTIPQISVASASTNSMMGTETSETNTAIGRDAQTATEPCSYDSAFTNTPLRTYSIASTNTSGSRDESTNTTESTYNTVDTNTTTAYRRDIGSNTIETIRTSVESNTDKIEHTAVETNTAITSNVGVGTSRVACNDMQTNTSLSSDSTTSTRRLVMHNADTNTPVTANTSTSTHSGEVPVSYSTSSTNTSVRQNVETNTPLISQSTVETNTLTITSDNSSTSVSGNTGGRRVRSTMCFYCGHTKCDSLNTSVQTDSVEKRDHGVGGRPETAETGSGNSVFSTVDNAVGDHTARTADSWTVTSSAAHLDKGTATVQIHMIHRNEATDSINTTDASTMPADDVTTTYRGALAALASRPSAVSRGTSTAAKPETVESETSTEPRPMTTDTGTITVVDVTAAYRGLLLGRQGGKEHLVTISRGTMTLRTRLADSQTTTDPTHRDNVERGSSPIRFRGIDKSVSVNRASLTEPSEVFVRASADSANKMAAGGNGSASATSGGLRRQISGSCPRMDSICEGSDESASDGEYKSSTARRQLTRTSPVAPTLRRPVLPPRPLSDDLRRFRLPIERRVLTALPPIEQHPVERAGRVRETGVKPSTSSSVGVEAAECCPLRGVEVSTNTTWVERRDQSTGTDSLTSPAVVDGKMAECINKLRTVRQRLEQQQTTSTKIGSPPLQRAVCLSPLMTSPESSSPPTSVSFQSMTSSDFKDGASTMEIWTPRGDVSAAKPNAEVSSTSSVMQDQDAVGGLRRQHVGDQRTAQRPGDIGDRLASCRNNEKTTTGTKSDQVIGGNVALRQLRELPLTPPQSARALKGDAFPSGINKRMGSSVLPPSPSSTRKNEPNVLTSPRLRQKAAASSLSKPEIQTKVVMSPPLKRGSLLSSPGLKQRPSTAAVMEGLLRGTASRTNKLSSVIDEEKASMSGSTESTTSSSGDDQDTAMLMRMMSGVQAAGSAAQRSRQHRQLQPPARQRPSLAASMMTSSMSPPPSGTASPVQQRRTSLARKQRLDLTQLLVSKTEDAHSHQHPDDVIVTTATSSSSNGPQSQQPEQPSRRNPLSPVTTRRSTAKLPRRNDVMRF